MKKVLAILLAILSLAAVAANTFSVGDGKVPDFSKYKRLKVGLENHGREVKSDFTTLPGCVIHWFADGTVQTNKLIHIDCQVQTNTTEQTLAKMSATIATQFVALTNEMAKCSSLSNLLVIVSAQAEAATAKINDEVADLQAKIVKYEEYKTKYPLLKTVWAALIADAENRIKILQALTGQQ